MRDGPLGAIAILKKGKRMKHKIPPKLKCREAMILARRAHSAHKALLAFPADGDAEVRYALELLCAMQLSNRNRMLAVR